MALKEVAEAAMMVEVAGVRNLEATKKQVVAIEEAVSPLGRAVVVVAITTKMSNMKTTMTSTKVVVVVTTNAKMATNSLATAKVLALMHVLEQQQPSLEQTLL